MCLTVVLTFKSAQMVWNRDYSFAISSGHEPQEQQKLLNLLKITYLYKQPCRMKQYYILFNVHWIKVSHIINTSER